eukprot:6204696-Pleurochrysis_carterae.AAC.2
MRRQAAGLSVCVLEPRLEAANKRMLSFDLVRVRRTRRSAAEHAQPRRLLWRDRLARADAPHGLSARPVVVRDAAEEWVRVEGGRGDVWVWAESWRQMKGEQATNERRRNALGASVVRSEPLAYKV